MKTCMLFSAHINRNLINIYRSEKYLERKLCRENEICILCPIHFFRKFFEIIKQMAAVSIFPNLYEYVQPDTRKDYSLSKAPLRGLRVRHTLSRLPY
jgi:hypothetical protein